MISHLEWIKKFSQTFSIETSLTITKNFLKKREKSTHKNYNINSVARKVELYSTLFINTLLSIFLFT